MPIKQLRKLKLADQPVKRAPRKNQSKQKASLRNVVRTPGTIIRALQTTSRAPSGLPHYVMCRTNPFHGHGGSAIPDGKNSNFVVTDTFAVNNFTPSAAGQTIIIQTLNAFPALAMIGSTANFTVDGTLVTGLGALQPVATAANTSYYPVCIPPPLVGTGAVGSAFADPYNSTTARMISCGFRLIYTGPATTCAGSITVTPNPVGWGQTATSATGAFGISSPTIAGAAGAVATAGAQIIDCDITISTTALTRASKTFRPEQGVYIVPTHRSTDFKMNPTLVCALAPTANLNTATGAVNVSSLLRPAGGVNPGIIWYDNDWTTYSIVIHGMNSDASFRLESVACMEYNPAITSAFYPLSVKASPTAPNQIKQATDINQQSDTKPAS